MVVVYGDATSPNLSDLDVALDGLVATKPSNLTVDLSQTSHLDVATLRAIARRGHAVPHFDLILPPASPSSTAALSRGTPGRGGTAGQGR